MELTTTITSYVIDSLSTLELDDTFDPSSEEAQEYLMGFCDRLFATPDISPSSEDYQCSINAFSLWLEDQHTSLEPTEEYVANCVNASQVPMPEEAFHPCMISWSRLVDDKNVLSKRDKVKIIRMRTLNTIGWDESFTAMDAFWNRHEDFMDNERSNAPSGVNGMFHTSAAFWWYDTNISMLSTAIGAAAIAVSFSAIIVLLSSRSLMLTLFSAVCISYVLAATTASLVGFGWDLGFLESICFAILIGISCDFVIHFGHAYNHKKGAAPRSERTKYAVIHMGPSILAAAFTTIAAAIAMLFCTITFFTKFALILLMTIVHATIGSFVVYLVMTDSFGPSEPTKVFDSILAKCTGGTRRERQKDIYNQKEQQSYEDSEWV